MAAVAMSQPTLAVVRNVSACATLGTTLALDQLQAKLGEKNCRRGSSKMNLDVLYVTCKSLSDSATASVYASGQMTLVGATSEEQAKLFARKVARMVHKAGFVQVQHSRFKVTSVAATYEHGKCVRLEGVAYEHQLYTTYEPELHPGLTYRMQDWTGAVIIVYTNGKCTITGPSRADVETASARIAEILKKHERSERL
jgi:transcription initiation factor TFIID TATA-box-binding protein